MQFGESLYVCNKEEQHHVKFMFSLVVMLATVHWLAIIKSKEPSFSCISRGSYT